jgi:hypothetical protein
MPCGCCNHFLLTSLNEGFIIRQQMNVAWTLKVVTIRMAEDATSLRKFATDFEEELATAN